MKPAGSQCGAKTATHIGTAQDSRQRRPRVDMQPGRGGGRGSGQQAAGKKKEIFGTQRVGMGRQIMKQELNIVAPAAEILPG